MRSSNEIPIQEKWEADCNALDAAIAVAASKAELGDLIPGHYDPSSNFLIDEALSIPFTSARKMEVAIYKIRSREDIEICSLDLSVPDKDVIAFAAIKGAPDFVLGWAKFSLVFDPQSNRLVIDNSKTDFSIGG